MNKQIALQLMLFGLCVLTGCSSLVKVKDTSTQIDAVMPEIAPEWTMAGVENRVKSEPIAWMDRLEDPVLKQLVDQALTNNPSLQAASANIDRARALARIAGAALKPQIGAGLGTENAGLVSSSSDATTTLGLELSWEVDLWGRLKARRNAGEESFAAVVADYRGARNLLAASTARAYLLAIEAGRQEEIARSQVNALSEILRIVQARSDNGMASSREVSLALTDLESAREQRVAIEGARRNAVRALELLLGRYPDAATDLPGVLPTLPEPVASGLPSELLERRPDLVAAERRVAGSLNLLHEAKAARLPSFRLTGELGGASNGLTDILSESNVAWKAVNSLLAPILSGGALRAGVDVATADVEMALANYVETALNAFSEVETALDQKTVLDQRETMLGRADDEAKKALDLERVRYGEGESGMLDLLIIQQKRFAIQSNHLSVKRRHLEQYITLHLVLGGDF